MAVSERRDREFWAGVFADPEVTPALMGLDPEAALDLVENPAVLPLASESGGFLFIARDGLGAVYELHSAYKRAGWGREVFKASREAFARMFNAGAQLIFTQEIVGNGRTRAPRSFGFVPAGEPFANEMGRFRLWVLTRDAWLKSRAYSEEMH